MNECVGMVFKQTSSDTWRINRLCLRQQLQFIGVRVSYTHKSSTTHTPTHTHPPPHGKLIGKQHRPVELRRISTCDRYLINSNNLAPHTGHAIEGAPGIRGLVLMSGPASMEEWTAETLRLRDELPAEVRETLAR